MDNEIISVENLIEIKQSDTISIFSDEEKIQGYLDKVRSVSFIGEVDLTTKKGRDEIASRAYKVSKMKGGVVKKMITPSIEEHRQIIQSVSSGKKFWESKMDDLRDEVRAPLNNWEAEQEIIEEKRIVSIEAKITGIENLGILPDEFGKDYLTSMIEAVDNIDISEGFDEFTQKAIRAKEAAKSTLSIELNKLIQKELEDKQRQELAEQKVKLDEQQRRIDDAEKERKIEKSIQNKLTKLAQIPSDNIGENSRRILGAIDRLQSYPLGKASYGDRTKEANTLLGKVIKQLQTMFRQKKQIEEIEEQKQRDQKAEIEATLVPKNDGVPHRYGLFYGTIKDETKTQSTTDTQDIPPMPSSSPDNETVESQSSQEIIEITVFGKSAINDDEWGAIIISRNKGDNLVKFKPGKDINSVLELFELA